MLGIKVPASSLASKPSGLLAPKLGNLLDLSQDGLVLLNSEGQITAMNTEAQRILNCADRDFSGLDFWEAMPPTVAELHQVDAVQAVERLQKHSFVAHRVFEGDWFEYTFKPHSEGCVVNLKEVTAIQSLQCLLAESEFTNRLLFKENPNAMWVYDMATSHILDVNQAAIDFYGILKNNFINLKLGALFPDGSGAALLSSVSVADATKVTLQICRQVKGDGTVVLVELASSRISWHGQEATLVTLADVSERHISDRTLRRENTQLKLALSCQNDELKNARRDVNSFAYALSHDLQVPLHAASGFTAMLAEKYGPVLDDKGRHYISRIQASTRKMAELVDDLRTLVQLPQLAGELEKLDVGVLCATIIDELKIQHPDRSVIFDVQTGSWICANRRMLLTALSCLLKNAWKFTGKKSAAWIKVAVIPTDTHGELVLQVSDNGVGFDAEYSNKLFMAFQRLHSSADYAGNGLGLVTVKRVAERHGGRVWAESTPTGASFFMALPQTQALTVRQSVR